MEQPDQVGRASARLLANGIGRDDRLDALHLLGILDACADTTGRVRRPLDDLAAEFELDPVDVLRSLCHLEAAGATRRVDGALAIVDRDEGGAGGLLLSDFIEDVRAVLDDTRPAPRRWPVRAGAALAAAAAMVAAVTLAPVQPGSPPSVAVGGTSEGAVTPQAPPSVPGSSSPVTSATPVTAAPVTTVTPVPGAAPPIADGTVVAASCPAETPVVEVIGSRIEVTNLTGADIVVSRLAVEGAPLLLSAFIVPAGATVSPPAVVPAAADDVTILDWDWDDPVIGDRCE